jgi:CP family cyanate transporter-like MFS transporter
MALRRVLLGVAIALVAFNLRPAVASVGPVLPDIRADLGLTAAAAALLTMLPVLCFGLLAPAAPRLARRFGIEWVLLGVLFVLVGSLIGRVLDGSWLLFIGSAVAGVPSRWPTCWCHPWSSGTSRTPPGR